MQKTLVNILLVALSVFVAGCGFTLRSANYLPPQLHTIFLATPNPYDEFELGFKQSLQTLDVTIATDSATAPYILYLSSNYSTSVTSPATSVQARIYTLNYRATISLISHQGKTILPTQIVSATRNLTLTPNEIFEASNQSAIYKQEMRQELTTKILNILSSKSVSRALNHP